MTILSLLKDHFFSKVTQLEGESGDGLQLCLHERDFKIGRPIAENIVACLEQSRSFVLVLSSSYAKSSW
jgi:hypothetical protein